MNAAAPLHTGQEAEATAPEEWGNPNIARARASRVTEASPWDETGTPSDYAPSRPGPRELGALVAGKVDKALSGEPVQDYQPSSYRMARARHHEASYRLSHPLNRGARLAWGYFHLLVIRPLMWGGDWLGEHPAWFFLAVVLAVTVLFWP